MGRLAQICATGSNTSRSARWPRSRPPCRSTARRRSRGSCGGASRPGSSARSARSTISRSPIPRPARGRAPSASPRRCGTISAARSPSSSTCQQILAEQRVALEPSETLRGDRRGRRRSSSARCISATGNSLRRPACASACRSPASTRRLTNPLVDRWTLRAPRAALSRRPVRQVAGDVARVAEARRAPAAIPPSSPTCAKGAASRCRSSAVRRGRTPFPPCIARTAGIAALRGRASCAPNGAHFAMRIERGRGAAQTTTATPTCWPRPQRCRRASRTSSARRRNNGCGRTGAGIEERQWQ